jgi:hypothetical protein
LNQYYEPSPNLYFPWQVILSVAKHLVLPMTRTLR